MSTRKWSLLPLVAIVMFLAGCQESDPVAPDRTDARTTLVQTQEHTFMGPPERVGDGFARTWYTADASNAPVTLGVFLSEKALDGLSTGDPESFVLRFHRKADVLGYTHVLLDYNPHGHEPPGVYDLPHFDVHFYLMSIEERLAITADDPGFVNEPAPQYLPEDYLRVPGGVPQMGVHWVDLRSPEFNGETFTRTFVYGSYDTRVIFFEPMLTVDYLRSVEEETIPIRQPAAYQEDGYYATSYTVRRVENPEGWVIGLGGFRFVEGQ